MATTSVSQLAFGTVINPIGTTNGDGSQIPMVAGRGGDQLLSEVHGRFYQMAYRGNLFYARSPVAGSVIPIDSDITANHWKFGVLNPAGSGVNMEVLQARMDNLAAGTIISEEYLFVAQGALLTAIIAGTTTILAGAVQNAIALGGWSAKTQGVLSQYTLAASEADLHLCGIGAYTTTTTNNNIFRNFDGGLIIPPGSLLMIAGTAAQTTAQHVEFMYAEVPV